MAEKDDDGSKTEKPTPKKIKDAKEKGNVAKSKDLTGSVILLFWLAFITLASTLLYKQLGSLMILSLNFNEKPFLPTIYELGNTAIDTLLMLSAAVLLPTAVLGLVTVFLQTGAIFTLEKMKPNMENLDPVGGVKRMFSMDNLIEVLKSVFKACLIFTLAWLVFRSASSDIIQLFYGNATNLANAFWKVGFKLGLWVGLCSVFISALDIIYQRYSFTKKLKMSMRDIKQEYKDSEGDPQVKGQRRQMHREFTENGMLQATQNANVLLVNPTHFAVAIHYDNEQSPVPKVSAKAQGEMAMQMRQVATESKIPILRNIELTRHLFSTVKTGKTVPRELFDIIADVLVWAKHVKAVLEDEVDVDKERAESSKAPGEDLTRYW